MTPSSIIFYVKVLGVLALSVFVMSIVTNYTSMSGTIAAHEQTIKRLEGKLNGAYMRIDRRDNAIGALPEKCRVQALEWVKTGDIPAPFNPFGAHQDNR